MAAVTETEAASFAAIAWIQMNFIMYDQDPVPVTPMKKGSNNESFMIPKALMV